MSVFASLRRSVGFGGGGSTTDENNGNMVSQSTSTLISSTIQNMGVKDTNNTNQSSPSKTPLANLILENKNGKVRASYPIRKQITKIGRLASNDIRIYRETVSRVHCEIHIVKERSSGSLHIFNPRGVKVNGKEVETEVKGKRIMELTNDDLIEIYANYFRFQIDQQNSLQEEENDENSPPLTTNIRVEKQKSMRMSLVRSKVIQQERNHSKQSSNPFQSSYSSDRSPLKALSSAENDPQSEPSSQLENRTSNTSPKKVSSIQKGRRSLLFATPKREYVRQAPYTAEPIKQPRNENSTSTSSERAQQSRSEKPTAAEDDSIIFMEEVEEETDAQKEPEMLLNELDALLEVAPIQRPDSQEEKDESMQEEHPVNRQTKSSSPKKMKRRSSFFGRAGIFANWNFGFYPEERKAAEEDEEKKEEGEGLLSTSSSAFITSPNGTRLLPEPRLDSQGRPRLPRSLSSPDGLTYSSPKRRVVSLRTATLLRQGQNAFEQQKLRSPPTSPPSSPTKIFSTGGSLMGSIQQMLSAEPKQQEEQNSTTTTSREEPKMTSDADDEDEINQSLSLADDEDEEDDDNQGRLVSGSNNYKARKSYSSILHNQDKSENKRKSRISMPAKLISVTSVEGHSNDDIEDLKRQWLDEQEKAENDLNKVEQQDENMITNVIESHADHGKDTDSESERDDESDVEGKDAMENKDLSPVQDIQIANSSSTSTSPEKQYGMLRYMVRENAELTALIDTVTQSMEEKDTKDAETDARSTVQSTRATVTVKETVDHVLETESKVKQEQASGENGWKLVSPRRSKWKPNESKPVQNRRVSESLTVQKRSELNKTSPRKKTVKRRTTSTAVVRIVNDENDDQNEKVSEIVNSNTFKEKSEKASSPKKPSPRKRSPVKKSTVSNIEQPPVNEEEMMQVEVEAPDTSKSKSKPVLGKVDVNVISAPINKSPLKLKKDGHSNDLIQSSSPTKKRRTRSPKKGIESQERKEEVEEEKENIEPNLFQSSSPSKIEEDQKGIRKTTRGKKKIERQQQIDCPASEPVMPNEAETAVTPIRTTRSGRSVRKPKDLLQPTTVISIQSDPVGPAETTTGRVTRSRARRGAV